MIVIVRHGETALNAARILQPPDVRLNERGERQAARVAERVADLGIHALLSSDLRRAQMTADAIALRTGLSVELESLLQERNFGELRGRAYGELGREVWAADYRPPGGESLADFDERVAAAWTRVVQVAAATAGHLAVVTHGLVCASIARQFLSLPGEERVPSRFGNTSLTICDAVAPHSVRTLNCVEHLRGLADASDGDAPSGL